MRYNHFSMLPEQAFCPRAFGGMTLEGGGGGGPEEPQGPVPTRNLNPQPISPYQSAGGGFMGRTPFGTPGSSSSFPESRFNAEYYLQQNPDVAADPYYGQNPFHHFQDFGFQERRRPSETQEYRPSQQPLNNPAYAGREDLGLVNQAYQSILGRAPTAGEQQTMASIMREGLTGQGLAALGSASPEFQRQREFERGYSELFRPDYQEFGPSGQYYQPIYQSNYRNYMQPTQFYSPGYGGGFGGGMRNPFAYGGGMGGRFLERPAPMPRQMSGMQEGDDFIPRGPRSQMSPAQAFSDFFKQLHPGQTAPPPPITAADNVPVIQRASSVTPGDVTRALLGSSPGLPASLRGGMAKGGHVDEGIAGLLKK